MKRLSLLLVLTLMTSLIFAQEKINLPPDGVGIIGVKNLKAAFDQIDGTFKALDIPYKQEYLIGTLTKVFLAENLVGVDLNKPCYAVFVNPDLYHSKPYAIFVPVTNLDEYLKAVGKVEKGADGILQITKNIPYFDKQAYMEAQRAGKPIDFKEFQKNVEKKFYGVVQNNYVAISSKEDVLKAAIVPGEAYEEPLLNGNGFVHVFVGRFVKIYDNKIQEFQSKFGEHIGKKLAEFGKENEVLAKLLGVYLDTAIAFVKQIDRVSYGVDLTPQGIIFDEVVQPVKEGPIAAFHAEQKAIPLSLMESLPQDSFFAFGGNLKFDGVGLEYYLKFIDKIVVALGDKISAEDVKKMKDMIPTFVKAYGSEIAFGLSSTPDGGFSLVEIFRIIDQKLANEIMEQYLTFISSGAISRIYGAMGMKFDASYKKEVIEGVEYINIKFNYSIDSMPENAKEMMKKIYGEAIEINVAMQADKMIVVMGKDAAKRLLDTVKNVSTLSQNTDFINARSGFMAGDHIMCGYISPGKYIEWIKKLVGNKDLEKFKLGGGTDILFASTAKDSVMYSKALVPINLISEIKNAYFTMVKPKPPVKIEKPVELPKKVEPVPQPPQITPQMRVQQLLKQAELYEIEAKILKVEAERLKLELQLMDLKKKFDELKKQK